jgi:tetratricopeptide (TPR) repeat protein
MSTLRSACLLLLCCAAAPAQDTRVYYTLFGQVVQPDGSPSVHARVQISGLTGGEHQAVTDDMGRFEVPSVMRGRYRLTATNPEAPDQVSDGVELELGRGQPGRVSVNIYLRHAPVAVRQNARPGAVSVTEAAQEVPKPAMKVFEQALKQRSERQFERAFESFTRSIGLYPSFFQALAERGHLLISMGKLDEAARDFAKALELDAHYGPALRGSGICKIQQGKYAEAVQELQAAADAEPGNPANFLFMGTADTALGRTEQARAALHRALTIDPKGAARAHVQLANLSIRENKPAEALAEIEAYLSKVPDPPDKERLLRMASQLRASTGK